MTDRQAMLDAVMRGDAPPVPVLIDRCLRFEATLNGECALHMHDWKRLGIYESIAPSEKRP